MRHGWYTTKSADRSRWLQMWREGEPLLSYKRVSRLYALVGR